MVDDEHLILGLLIMAPTTPDSAFALMNPQSDILPNADKLTL